MYCSQVIHEIDIIELMELESMDCLDKFRENILNGRENYEWDIISIFKIYNNFIENPPSGIPTCQCELCCFFKDNTYLHYIDQINEIKRYVYIMWFMKEITDKNIIERTRNFINHRNGKEIKKRIDEYYDYIYSNQLDFSGLCFEKKEYYYQKLFGIPYILFSIGVPEQHYLWRDLTYFNDTIAGHPKASDGWFMESFKDTVESGFFAKGAIP